MLISNDNHFETSKVLIHTTTIRIALYIASGLLLDSRVLDVPYYPGREKLFSSKTADKGEFQSLGIGVPTLRIKY